ncbi:hypothetical protein ACLOJK_030328 [Asimina triloba]
MRAKRGKRSEAFWPSLVMKKWLNIKPKVNEFSEDEVETETESEDDGMLSAGYLPSMANPPRHRRGKSETLRVQYINAKDVRVVIGTWNVAGRLPHKGLEIDEWLCTEEPADMYILGFQEVVPLNAGNVFGAEDNRPIPKWEAIIRRTLNKSLQPKTKYKCYSAPPSPVMRTSSAADALADEMGAPGVTLDSNLTGGIANGLPFKSNHLSGINELGKKLQLKRIYGIDSDSKVDWPEISLDTPPHVLSSNPRLRRVSSSSARMGCGRMEQPLVLASQKLALGGSGLKRMYCSSGNLQHASSQQKEEPEFNDPGSDVSDDLSEEEDDTPNGNVEGQLEDGADAKIVKDPEKYVRIVSKQMVGIYVSLWVRKRLRRHINNLKVFPVGVGLMGYMGNKGSVSVSMSLFQTRLCFVCSHLTSGHKYGDEEKRNSDVYEIIRRTRFSSTIDADQPQTIPSHDQIFWFGDLNYRLNMVDADVRKLVAMRRWDELINSDQLCRELRRGRVFDGWKEGIIDFPPTYKYEINSDKYVGENPKEGEKKRSPAWCDRILWLGKSIKQLSYRRADLRLSDHRPVSSIFQVEVEVFDHRKLKRALNYKDARVHPGDFLVEEDSDIPVESFSYIR